MGIVRYDNPVFIYYDTGGDRAANVRFYFRTLDHTLGESQYWWSTSSFELRYLFPGYPRFWLATAFMPGAWSDRDGHIGDADPAHVTAFAAAAADVQEIGLSFGGGNNYAFGVGVGSGGATFQLTKIWVQ